MIALAQFVIELGIAFTHFRDRSFCLGLEARFTAIEIIEAPRDFTCEFDMRHLVFTDRHIARLVDQNIGGLQQRIP